MSDSKQWTMRGLLVMGGAGIVVLIFAFLMTNMVLNKQADRLNQLQVSISQSSVQMLMLRRHEKDFIARLDSKYRTKIHNEAERLKQRLIDIEIMINDAGVTSSFNSLASIDAINTYLNSFDTLADTLVRIYGQDKSDGLVDDLQQESIRFQRQILRENNASLDQQMLVVQERMFDLFTDLSAENKQVVDEELQRLQQIIQTSASSVVLEEEFAQFDHAFTALHNEVESFGYDHNSGQLGAMRKTIHGFEGQLDTLYVNLPSTILSKLETFRIYYYGLAVLLCLSIVVVIGLVIRSITQLESGLLKSQQRERNANKAKSSFLANMSHEIRTPLNGIIGMTDILNESRLTPVQKDYLTTINSSSQTLLMLINDILDLSKIESGNLEVCPHTCAIKEVIFDTAALIAPKAQQKNVKIKIEMDADIPAYVRADEQKLRQVAMNLASNAIKFTEAGAVTFKLKVSNRSSDKISLYFAVKDTGIGIDESKHGQVFEEFKQESSQTSTEFGGTGLGLAISTKMIAMMGSKIELTSAKGLGSEFFFTLDLELEQQPQGAKSQTFNLPQVIYCSEKPSKLLIQELNFYQYPLEVVQNKEEILPHISSQAILLLDETIDVLSCSDKYNENIAILVRENSSKTSDFGAAIAGYITLPLLGHRLDHLLKTIQTNQQPVSETPEVKSKMEGMILVVEDNKVNQQVVGVNLKKLGIEHRFANNGAEAVSLYKEHHESIVLILMDCMMPVMDGFEATSTIRAFEQMESLEETYIIALTASILDDDIQRCFDSGMNDYLPKPFRKAVLIEKLEKNVSFGTAKATNTDDEPKVTRLHGG